MKLKNLIPMLNVSNIEQSLDFYQKALGFEVVSNKEAVNNGNGQQFDQVIQR